MKKNYQLTNWLVAVGHHLVRKEKIVAEIPEKLDEEIAEQRTTEYLISHTVDGVGVILARCPNEEIAREIIRRYNKAESRE